MEGNEKTLKLYNELATHWNAIADLIGMKNASLIRHNHPEDNVQCIEEVMRKWMDDPRNLNAYPCTWKGLCELLNDVELSAVSESLNNALQADRSNFKECPSSEGTCRHAGIV